MIRTVLLSIGGGIGLKSIELLLWEPTLWTLPVYFLWGIAAYFIGQRLGWVK